MHNELKARTCKYIYDSEIHAFKYYKQLKSEFRNMKGCYVKYMNSTYIANVWLLLDIYVPSSVIHSENRRRVTYGR